LPSLVADTTDLEFAAALRGLMAARGVSVRQLAQRLSLGPARVGNLRSGYGSPTIGNIVEVAAALDVQPSFFREYREHLVVLQARRAARVHGADAVLDKLAELD